MDLARGCQPEPYTHGSEMDLMCLWCFMHCPSAWPLRRAEVQTFVITLPIHDALADSRRDDPGIGHPKQVKSQEGTVPVTTYRRSCMPGSQILMLLRSAAPQLPRYLLVLQGYLQVSSEMCFHLISESVSVLNACYVSVLVYLWHAGQGA